MGNTTEFAIGRGFRAKVGKLNGTVFLNIRRYYVDFLTRDLRPGIPGITLHKDTYETLKSIELPAEGVEVDLGKNRALGRYRGAMYLCRYRPYEEPTLNHKRDYIILTSEMYEALMIAACVLDTDFDKMQARVDAAPTAYHEATCRPVPVDHQRLIGGRPPLRRIPAFYGIPPPALQAPKRRAPPKKQQGKRRKREDGSVPPPPPQPDFSDIITLSMVDCGCGNLMLAGAPGCVACRVEVIPETQPELVCSQPDPVIYKVESVAPVSPRNEDDDELSFDNQWVRTQLMRRIREQQQEELHNNEEDYGAVSIGKQ